jgi:hypothetical protein
MPTFDLRTIDNYIYIFHLPGNIQGEGTWIVLPQWPDQITDKITSSFASQSALGRSAPVFSYINSGPRTVDISVQLHRDMMDEANINLSNIKPAVGDDYVDTVIKQLQAIALPNYHSANKEVEPPMVAVRFGEEIFIKGVVNGGISVEYRKPLLTNGKYAEVNISFTVEEVDPQDAISISKTGSFRNITRTFKKGIYKGE